MAGCSQNNRFTYRNLPKIEMVFRFSTADRKIAMQASAQPPALTTNGMLNKVTIYARGHLKNVFRPNSALRPHTNASKY
jgi:hypothetical protein